jgi:hypothetical protein
MAPGFTGDIFEGGNREKLLKLYPGRADDIRNLTSERDESRMPKGFAS